MTKQQHLEQAYKRLENIAPKGMDGTLSFIAGIQTGLNIAINTPERVKSMAKLAQEIGESKSKEVANGGWYGKERA
jgi:hypothetical protein